MDRKRNAEFYALAAFFGAFLIFLYGPTLTIFVLSLQGPEGSLVFPMRGLSLYWFARLFEGIGVIDIGAALWRSFKLGLCATALTVLLAVSASLAYRKSFRGAGLLFYLSIASLIMPSIIVSLGIGLSFRLLDTQLQHFLAWAGWHDVASSFTTSMGLYTSALGAQLTWTLPFGLLIMFAVFNRFNAAYEEAARDLGATAWQGFRMIVLPLIGPSVVGVAMFGFTLSWDEIARTSQAIGDLNTLPLELQGLTTTVTTPVIYALGTLTTLVSCLVVGLALWLAALARRRTRSTP
jgi:putative spermidine/putrescine transport system permease protein